jgi:hypothetical protein
MKRRSKEELMSMPAPRVPPITHGSRCPLCRARDGRERLLETAPTLGDIFFSGLIFGIMIGKTEPINERWCSECRLYIERTLELADAVRPS